LQISTKKEQEGGRISREGKGREGYKKGGRWTSGLEHVCMDKILDAVSVCGCPFGFRSLRSKIIQKTSSKIIKIVIKGLCSTIPHNSSLPM
jgi:hypothetical protein